MEYTIRKFNESIGQIIVEYRGASFAIDLPIDENKNYPIGAELDSLIKQFLPLGYFERLDEIAAGVNNADSIKSLVIPHPEPEPARQAEQPATMGTQTL